MSSTYITQDDVVISSSPKLTPRPPTIGNSFRKQVPQVQISVSDSSDKDKAVKMREMLLADNSVESS